MLLRVLLYVVIGYGGLILFVYLRQDRLLYFPEIASPSVGYLSALRLAMWPAAGADWRGLTGIAVPAGTNGTVIVFHGNAGGAADRAHYEAALARLGYRVVLAEYPGYSGRPGRRRERDLLADALETVRRAHAQFGGPVYLWGESLGSGVATGVAASSPVPIRGVVLLTPWASLPDLAQSLYPHLPARWLTRDRYDNVSNLAGFHGPVCVLVAERDELMPRTHTRRLFEGIRSPKRWIEFKGALHNTWPAEPGEPWWGEAMAFVSGR